MRSLNTWGPWVPHASVAPCVQDHKQWRIEYWRATSAERREKGEDGCLHGPSRLADPATTSESSRLSLAPRNSRDLGQFWVFGTHNRHGIAAMNFLTVPTATFRVL
jgi:hypothetical protein